MMRKFDMHGYEADDDSEWRLVDRDDYERLASAASELWPQLDVWEAHASGCKAKDECDWDKCTCDIGRLKAILDAGGGVTERENVRQRTFVLVCRHCGKKEEAKNIFDSGGYGPYWTALPDGWMTDTGPERVGEVCSEACAIAGS